MQFFVFALVSFVAAARDGVFMSKCANLAVIADGLDVLQPMLDRLDH